jgi:hypothetical protein
MSRAFMKTNFESYLFFLFFTWGFNLNVYLFIYFSIKGAVNSEPT